MLIGPLALLLAACDRATPPAEEHAGLSPAPGVEAIAGDPLSLEIRRIKDLLLADRLMEARQALQALEERRSALPAERQIEIDRLAALFAGAR